MWLTSVLGPNSGYRFARENPMRPRAARRQPHSHWARYRPIVETLEDRAVPAILFNVDSLDDGPVNLSDGTLTLRDALFVANSRDEIDFEPSLFAAGPGAITLNQGQLGIRTDLTITGPGADLL